MWNTTAKVVSIVIGALGADADRPTGWLYWEQMLDVRNGNTIQQTGLSGSANILRNVLTVHLSLVVLDRWQQDSTE